MNKRKKYLWVGLMGAIAAVCGQLAGGLSPAYDFTSPITVAFSSLRAVPLWRLGLCACLGSFGILLQYFGYQGIYLSFEDRENKKGRLYHAANFCFAPVGALCHVLLCVFLCFYPAIMERSDGSELLLDFLLFFCLPLAVLFLVGAALVCLLMAIQIGGGHSSFSRWCILLNPLPVSLLIGTGLFFLPHSSLVNGLGFACTGLSSLLIFSVFLMANHQKH